MKEVIKISDEKAIEEHFAYLGRDCIITFCNRGFRCGYVSLKDSEVELVTRNIFKKPFIELEYESLNIDCHGGLTFGNVLPVKYKPNEHYYVGFDCNHYLDGTDLQTAKTYGLKKNDFARSDLYHWTISLEECINECKSIVEQLNKKEQ